jgi:predicted nuclease with RNAse H fold
MIYMNGKRGRPATGRQESYYVIDPANFERHMNKIETERLINAYDYIHTMAFDVPLSWSYKRDFRNVNKKGVK